MDFPVVRFNSVKPVGKEKCDDECSSASVVSESDNEFVIHPEEWSNKMGDQTISSRVQIPLRLAWSISVHKWVSTIMRVFLARCSNSILYNGTHNRNDSGPRA